MKILMRLLCMLIVSYAFPFCQTATGASCVIPPPGLVSWWKSDGNVLDSFSTNAGFASNGVTFVTGKVSQAFNFDGTSGFVRIPGSASLDVGLQGGLTIEG